MLCSCEWWCCYFACVVSWAASPNDETTPEQQLWRAVGEILRESLGEFVSITLLKSAAVLSVESQKLKITLLIYQPSNWTQPPSSFWYIKKPEIKQTEPLHTWSKFCHTHAVLTLSTIMIFLRGKFLDIKRRRTIQWNWCGCSL
jgi:hypothetical protein